MTLEEYTISYEQYFHLARKIADEILHDYHLAGDVAQEVFTEMFLKKDTLNQALIKYWIILNTNRRAIDQAKKPYRRREMQTIDNDWGIIEPKSPLESEALILRQEYAQYQCSALAALKDYNKNWFDILIRYHAYGESYQSLAESYGITSAHLRVQVHRARKWLDKKVQELYD